MKEYRGFVIGFFELIPRVYAYNEDTGMSFELGLTDIQKSVNDKMYGYGSWKTILINSIKQLIDNYYETGG